MDLTPGSYPLGSDATLNLFGALIKRDGGQVTLLGEDLVFTADDTLVYRVQVNGSLHVLTFIPAPTLAEINAALTAIGIDPQAATAEERDLTKRLLKLKGGA